jgi:signal transduction histidine kinase
MNISVFRGDAIFCGFESNIDKIMTLLDQTIRYTRNLTFEISPPILYELGLVATLEWLGERFQEKHGISIKVERKPEDCNIGEDCRITIFKSVQELLTNAAKHSGASRIVIGLDGGPDHFRVKVTDNGRGFDPDAMEPGSSDINKFGLFNIRERLGYLGGDVRIISAPGKGTEVTLSLPYNRGKGNDTRTSRR